MYSTIYSAYSHHKELLTLESINAFIKDEIRQCKAFRNLQQKRAEYKKTKNAG